MYKTWASDADDHETLARDLEVHINEYVDQVISVSYAVSERHYVLIVYRPVEPSGHADAAVSVAEQIIDQVP